MAKKVKAVKKVKKMKVVKIKFVKVTPLQEAFIATRDKIRSGHRFTQADLDELEAFITGKK